MKKYQLKFDDGIIQTILKEADTIEEIFVYVNFSYYKIIDKLSLWMDGKVLD